MTFGNVFSMSKMQFRSDVYWAMIFTITLINSRFDRSACLSVFFFPIHVYHSICSLLELAFQTKVVDLENKEHDFMISTHIIILPCLESLKTLNEGIVKKSKICK